MVAPAYTEVAVLGDGENIFGPYLTQHINFPERLHHFLGWLVGYIRKADMRLASKYSLLYMEKQYARPATWHKDCVSAARVHGFSLHWSDPRKSAESLLAQEVKYLVHRPDFPNEVIVVSGDADLILALDHLRHIGRRREVCVMSCKDALSHWIRFVASGIIRLDPIMPSHLFT